MVDKLPVTMKEHVRQVTERAESKINGCNCNTSNKCNK